MQSLESFKGKRIHLIGIGGCSMSGIAMILKNLGYEVSGSDVKTSTFTDMLQKENIAVSIGHDAALVDGAGLVIYSAAIKQQNPEFARAKEQNIPMMERSVALGLISKDYDNVVCVSGCHGKTTITSMLALIASDSEADPTVHVGGMIDFLGSGVRVGNSNSFITEACEYVKSFLTLHPTCIIINNIDDDHLDFYKDINEIIATFDEFVALLPENGILFANVRDENTREVIDRCKRKVITYSVDGYADYTIDHLAYDELGCASFDVLYKNRVLGKVKLGVPGLHNVENALAAIAVATIVFNISIEDCVKALAHYKLVGRRFELMGEKDGVKIFHDYAHHPSEIKACLAAAKQYPHKKIFALFQCNSYTRAKTLKDKYATAFEDADVVMVPEIYPGRDIDLHEIHATDLVKAINEKTNNCVYLSQFTDIKAFLKEHWQPGDIVVALGSGDVNKQSLILLED